MNHPAILFFGGFITGIVASIIFIACLAAAAMRQSHGVFL